MRPKYVTVATYSKILQALEVVGLVNTILFGLSGECEENQSI